MHVCQAVAKRSVHVVEERSPVVVLLSRMKPLAKGVHPKAVPGWTAQIVTGRDTPIMISPFSSQHNEIRFYSTNPMTMGHRGSEGRF